MNDVTIIIPAYIHYQNQVTWLEKAIQTAIETECPVIVYDDASPVDMSEAAAKFIDQDVTWIVGDQQRGASYARNKAIEYASTTFILPLDCDDEILPDAVTKMMSYWNGRPVYPDVEKFGDTVDPHFQLRDFDCADLRKYVGVYSVNVLHTKEQWYAVGGYDESIEFYEDGHYNAKLMLKFCGVRCPEPLIRYRFHPTQRTKVYMNNEAVHARQVLDKIWRIKDMACCGKRRRQTDSNNAGASEATMLLNTPTKTAVTTKVQYADGELDMPLEMGELVLARYVGGQGKAKHTYRGVGSKRQYKKVVFGSMVYADPRDVREVSTSGQSLLIRIRVSVAKSAPAPAPAPVVEKPVMQRTPKTFEGDREPEGDIDIQNMSIRDIKNLDVTEEQAVRLLHQEQNGRERVGAIRYLEGLIGD